MIDNRSLQFRSLIFCSILLFFIPSILFLTHADYLKNASINLFFLAIATSYFLKFLPQAKEETLTLIKYGLYQSEKEQRELLELPNIFDVKLTTRQHEVAILLLQGYNYTEIGNMLFTSEKTARKHGSDLFKRISVVDLKDFRAKYSEIPKTIKFKINQPKSV